MSATVVPFPFSRRREYILRQIENVAGYRPDAAANYLGRRINDQVRRMRQASVPDEMIQADVEPVRREFQAGLNRLFGAKARQLA